MNRSDIHIGILPNRPVSEIAEIAARAEELGFGGIWIADSQSIFRDAYAALTLAAARTSKLLLATGVTNPITRHPAVVAGAMATLDELSGGRAICGIGVGESAVRTIGVRPSKLAELAQFAQAVRALTGGETVPWDGAQLKLTWAQRRVPVWFASSGPRSLRLGGEIADGVLFQVGAHPDLVRYGLSRIDEGIAAAGRPPGSVKRFVRLSCTVGEDRDRARDEARGYAAAAAGTVYSAVPHEEMPDGLYEDLKRMKEQYDYFQHAGSGAKHTEYITDLILDSIGVAGTPDDAVPRLRELFASGADGVVLTVVTPDPVETMQTLSESVISRLEVEG
jgi:5,10-methylenetetrahydromethanopterin reductase